MIKPTVGRVVWYRPGAGADSYIVRNGTDPMAAIVTAVYSDTLVNLVVFDASGTPKSRTSIRLVQEGESTDPGTAYCEWMPYQKGQAAKTEHAEGVAKLLSEQPQPRTP